MSGFCFIPFIFILVEQKLSFVANHMNKIKKNFTANAAALVIKLA